MATSKLGGADDRPRVHIRAYQGAWVYQFGIGPRASQSQRYPSPGIALDAALSYLNHVPAVIIYGDIPQTIGE